VSLEQSDTYTEEVLPKLSDGTDGRWRWGKETVKGRINELTGIQVGPEKRWDVAQIDFAEKEGEVKRIKPKSVWMGSEFSNEAGTLEVKNLLGKGVFDTPKPVGLLKYLMEQVLEEEDIVLDFFAGSGTTAHALFDFNSQCGTSNRFILVQLDEATDQTSTA
ncbi:MAG: DNA methyltransferase, partial [Candidatus Sedimenticola sp. 6PFRAG7]